MNEERRSHVGGGRLVLWTLTPSPPAGPCWFVSHRSHPPPQTFGFWWTWMFPSLPWNASSVCKHLLSYQPLGCLCLQGLSLPFPLFRNSGACHWILNYMSSHGFCGKHVLALLFVNKRWNLHFIPFNQKFYLFGTILMKGHILASQQLYIKKQSGPYLPSQCSGAAEIDSPV